MVSDYKRLDLDAFRHDLASALFHVASVFDDADDVQWAWQNLFDNIFNENELRPMGEGESYMEQTGMLVGNFEFNP